MKDFFSKIGRGIRRIPGMQKMNEVTFENDIRYRGPLSYRYLRILAWLILAAVQAYTYFLSEQAIAGKNNEPGAFDAILNGLYSLVVPLFLIAVSS